MFRICKFTYLFVRRQVNLGLVANLCKVLIITVESRVELHEAVYEVTNGTVQK